MSREKNRDEEIEEIIERKVQERMKKQREKIKEELKNRENYKENNNKNQGITRRDFLKKLGIGALGLGALSLPGVSGLNVKSGDGLQVYQNGTEYLDVTNTGIQINNTNLDLNGNSLVGKDKGGGQKPKISVDSNGEWIAKDDSGNEATLSEKYRDSLINSGYIPNFV